MSIDTLEIEMTRIPRQLEYFKLQLEYLKNINQIERPLMLLCMFLFVGLNFMQWIGMPSSTFGETCKTEGYLHSIDRFFYYKSKLHIDYSKY